MTDNAYIQAARAGQNDFWRYLVTIVLIVTLLFSVSLCLAVAAIAVSGNFNILDLPPIPLLAINLVPFLFLLAGLWVGVTRIHRRPFFSLINPVEGHFNWRRFFLSAGLWLLLAALSDVVLSLLQPGNYRFEFAPQHFFPYMLVAVLLLPVQSAAEELVFRGYLAQGLGLKAGFWTAWLAPSLLFGLLHGANPEVGAYGVLLTLPTYVIMGLVLGWVTLRSESLEMALGLHIANNLYSATLVTFPSSVLNPPSLFRIQQYDPLAGLVVLVVMALIYLVLIDRLGKGFFRGGVFASLTLIAMILLSACAPLGQTSAAKPALALEDCWLNGPRSPQMKARCGVLKVNEDPADPSGRQIELNVVVVKAVSRTPAPDPLFLLAGGPGQAATEAFLPTLSAIERLRFKRDLVMVDQRGTGRSNPLDCPDALSEGEESAFGEDMPLEKQVEWIETCRAELSAELGADPRLYTTEIAMSDLDQVREALGYEQINLLGVSYGTRAALTYLRLYPERVRSLILDGVVPPGWALGESLGVDAQNALDSIITRCANDDACRAAYPDLQNEFNGMMTALREQPVELTLPHPTSGEPTKVTFGARTAAAAIRLMSYSDLLAALLPMGIHSAAQGDYRLLASQYLMLADQLGGGLNMGMYYSVVCAEDAPYLPDFFEGGTYFEQHPQEIRAFCDAWLGDAAPADAIAAPQSSSVPALLISGTADPVTPPRNAEAAAKLLPNHLHLVLSGLRHNNFYAGCVPGILLDFLETASPRDLDTACIENIQPEPFFVGPAGPAP